MSIREMVLALARFEDLKRAYKAEHEGTHATFAQGGPSMEEFVKNQLALSAEQYADEFNGMVTRATAAWRNAQDGGQ